VLGAVRCQSAKTARAWCIAGLAIGKCGGSVGRRWQDELSAPSAIPDRALPEPRATHPSQVAGDRKLKGFINECFSKRGGGNLMQTGGNETQQKLQEPPRTRVELCGRSRRDFGGTEGVTVHSVREKLMLHYLVEQPGTQDCDAVFSEATQAPWRAKYVDWSSGGRKYTIFFICQLCQQLPTLAEPAGTATCPAGLSLSNCPQH